MRFVRVQDLHGLVTPGTLEGWYPVDGKSCFIYGWFSWMVLWMVYGWLNYLKETKRVELCLAILECNAKDIKRQASPENLGATPY